MTKINLIKALNVMAVIELHPDYWIVNHCPNGHSKGKVRAKYFEFSCFQCKAQFIVDKVIKP